ncbi:MAG: VOC family protein [Myxococcales bacterium]|nr:VOC family protein [Myxococcales bacterium]
MKLDHLTAIVDDREGAAAALARLLGVEPERVDLPGMAIATFAVAGVELHVNAPTGPGPVSDALATRGVHLHHVAFATEDLEREIQRVELLGFRVRGAPIETAPGPRGVPRSGHHRWRPRAARRAHAGRRRRVPAGRPDRRARPIGAAQRRPHDP